MNKPRRNHIIGKVYDITKESVNVLIKELDAYHQYSDKLELELEQLKKDKAGADHYKEIIDKAVQLLEKKK